MLPSKYIKVVLLISFSLLFTNVSFAQDPATNDSKKPSFWSKVRFGGNVGFTFSGNTFNAVIAPSAVYEFNSIFSAGVGLNFGYNNALNFKAINYGGSLIALVNPFQGLQLSAEFEQTGVSRTLDATNNINSISENFWYPSLFLGAGYRINLITIGFRYDILYNQNTSIYASAFAPFVRVFF